MLTGDSLCQWAQVIYIRPLGHLIIVTWAARGTRGGDMRHNDMGWSTMSTMHRAQ